MKIGVYFDLRNPPPWHRPWRQHYTRMLELVEEADHLGAASLWFSEHHFFEDGYLSQPLTFAAAAAMRTRRARLGTAVVLAPFQSPIHLAEQAALVDVLSDGRLDLGLGAGYRPAEFEAFGVDPSRRYALVDDAIEALEQAWTPVGGTTPSPLQKPLPIWLGYTGPRGARRAGRAGLALLSHDVSLEIPYREGLAEAGHDASRARMAGARFWVLADEPDAAWARIEPHAVYQRGSYRSEDRSAPPVPVEADELRRSVNGAPPLIEVLTVDEAAKRIRDEYTGSIVEQLFFWVSIAGMPDDLVDRHLHLLCTELAPRVAAV